MTPETYSELLKDLQKREKTLVPAYLATLRADPDLTAHLQARFEAAEVGGRFDDFATLCCRRSAVQFLLRTVYVRVLEDLGALVPPRIRGDWGLAAFREVAPALGVREFFKWTFRDLARDLPALFTPSREELPLPSEDLCRETWDLWHRMSGDRPVYAWTSDTFDSRFLGDLYQDLDAEVRKRFALLQTPEFVEKYILDHTLTPALAEFDPVKLRAANDCFRIIDPTCGSGHFLIGAFHRLADYWQAHGIPDPWDAAKQALESIWGCDINPHAVDIARFRLMLEVHARTGVTQLEKLASLTFNLRTMDSLIPWERGVTNQGELFPAMDRLSVYATPGERAANAAFLGRAFHAVVGNPPYITPKDPKKRDDYRLFWPSSIAGKYALSAPFVERFISLATNNGAIGKITANSFMKRQFGRALVQNVFSKWTILGIIDTSGAYIPGHGTPTVLLFLKKRTRPLILVEGAKKPTPDLSYSVRSILGKRGEPGRPMIAAEGQVWSAISSAPLQPEDTNPFITVAHVSAATYSQHPWSIGGGQAQGILAHLNDAGAPLASLKEFKIKIGNLTILMQDEVYFDAPPSVRRDSTCSHVELIEGEYIRDWRTETAREIFYPYNPGTWQTLHLDLSSAIGCHTWRYRTLLWNRRSRASKFALLRQLEGAAYYEYPFYSPESYNSHGIAFSFVATCNHFAISRGKKLFKQTAPLIRLVKRPNNGAEMNPNDEADEQSGSNEQPGGDLLYNLAGLLNSSALGFWMKQVFHDKGNGGYGGGIASEEWERFFEYDSTKLLKAPIVERDRDERVALAQALDSTANARAAYLPQAILRGDKWNPSDLVTLLASSREDYQKLTHRMVALQEELDWLTYGSYSLIDLMTIIGPTDIEPLAPGHRPFEILFARTDDEADDEEKSAWWSRLGHDRVTEIPSHYSEAVRTRLQARMDLIESDPKLQLIEQAAYKRRWQTPDFDSETTAAAESYLLDRLEDLFAPGGPLANPAAYRLEQIADAWLRNPRTVAVARVWKGSDCDLTLAVEQLLRTHGLPDNPRRIYTAEGLRTLAAWQKTWHLQDLEDQGKPLVDPETGKSLDTIESPPKFERAHFQTVDAFSIRGKLNVPRERFIVFADLTPSRYGWNGWRDKDRALVQLEAFGLARNDPQDPLGLPTVADPRRCGATLGLWESLPDVRRWGDVSEHEELLSFAEAACRQKSCPCEVVDAWQAWQFQQRQAKAKRPGRKASLPVVPATAPPPPPAEPDTVAVTLEDRAFVFRLIEPFGEGGATIADLSRSWGRQAGLLPRVLDDLLASGDLKTRGRGKKKIYIATSTRRAPET